MSTAAIGKAALVSPERMEKKVVVRHIVNVRKNVPMNSAKSL
jgi:hypothetical protein|tara:strand:- start:19172 stop:19297 length:126 start_codon:yes stop_codon:yes gene_type:complete